MTVTLHSLETVKGLVQGCEYVRDKAGPYNKRMGYHNQREG